MNCSATRKFIEIGELANSWQRRFLSNLKRGDDCYYFQRIGIILKDKKNCQRKKLFEVMSSKRLFQAR